MLPEDFDYPLEPGDEGYGEPIPKFIDQGIFEDVKGEGTGSFSQEYELGETPGDFSISFDMYGIGDMLTIYHGDKVLATTKTYWENGGGFSFRWAPKAGESTKIRIAISANPSVPADYTSWEFTFKLVWGTIPNPLWTRTLESLEQIFGYYPWWCLVNRGEGPTEPPGPVPPELPPIPPPVDPPDPPEGTWITTMEFPSPREELRIILPEEDWGSPWYHWYGAPDLTMEMDDLVLELHEPFLFEEEQPFRIESSEFGVQIEEPFAFTTEEVLTKTSELEFSFEDEKFRVEDSLDLKLDEIVIETKVDDSFDISSKAGEDDGD